MLSLVIPEGGHPPSAAPTTSEVKDRTEHVDMETLHAAYNRNIEETMEIRPDHPRYETWKEWRLSRWEHGEVLVECLRDDFGLKLGEGTRILEIGCDFGGDLLPFMKYGVEAHAIDLYPRPHFGRWSQDFSLNLTFRCEDVCRGIPYPMGYFDLVTSFDVLEHVSSQWTFVAEAMRVLKPGGMLVFSCPILRPIRDLLRKDPHYGIRGLSVMPRNVQKFLVEKVFLRGCGTVYDVGHIPTRRSLAKVFEKAAGITPADHVFKDGSEERQISFFYGIKPERFAPAVSQAG